MLMKIFKFKRKRYLSHHYNYDVEGEDLPDKVKNKINKKAVLISISVSLSLFFGINYVLNLLIGIFNNLKKLEGSLFDLGDAASDEGMYNLGNAFVFNVDIRIYLILSVFGFVIGAFLYSKINYKSEDEISYGQKGDSRFATIKEIEEQYPAIPEKGETFEGIGGFPVSHYKDKYYIDVDTVNNCILGVSRSGKGEIYIVGLIDILSRAKIKSSMVVNDPKGELFAAAKDTLENRGYDVQVLNLVDPMQSMSYNLLQLVIDAWLQGNHAEASKRANSISYTLYNNPNAGENAWAYQGAQNAVTALILVLVEHCVKHDCIEKITMPNVAELLNELGTLYYKENEDDFEEKNALDEYFKNLPQGHVAKKRYGSTSFSGEKARGTILSTANDGLQPFIDPLFAKMTSKNSIDLKQVGFSKFLFGQLEPSMMNKRISVSFHKNDSNKTLISSQKVKVKDAGMYSLNFDSKLTNGDLILIKYEDGKENYKLIYQVNFIEKKDSKGNIIYQKKSGKTNIPDYEREVNIIERLNTFPHVKQKLQMKYSDKPTAVFMIIPDYDSSNHTLASIFIKQLYTELATNCADTKGNKCHIRVNFILDEFGNLPAIDDMDQVLTVCLGRNILFNLVVQSYNQIKKKYGEASDTIKENCQNHFYIMSTNKDTIEELSWRAGSKTIITNSSNESHLDMDNKITKSADKEPIISTERLSQLIEGETLVIRSLHRQDKKRKKIRPYPIFNTRETNMPYRYQFLSSWFDTTKELNEIDIPSMHSTLDLNDLEVDLSEFIIDRKARQKYINRQNRQTVQSEIIQVSQTPKNPYINQLEEQLDKLNNTNDEKYIKILQQIIEYYYLGEDINEHISLDKLSNEIHDKKIRGILRNLHIGSRESA